MGRRRRRWFPARSEMPWNRRRRYLFAHFVDELLGYGFDIWGDDESDAEDESITFTHGLFGLFVSSLSFELWRRRTIDSRMGECEPDAEDELECVPYFILIIGFAVGHWWQGRVAEGAGLFALYAGAIWLASRRVEEG